MSRCEIKDEKGNIINEYYMEDRLHRNLQEKIIKQLQKRDKDFVMVVDGREGSGKCQPANSKVLMSNGDWKNIQDIKIGDKVISPQKNGTTKIATVLNTSDWFCKEVYDIISINKKEKLYSCSYNHDVPLLYRGKKEKEYKIKHVKPKDILKNGDDYKRNNIAITTSPIEFENNENCVVEPYTLGALLGDGYLGLKGKGRHIDITSNDIEIIKEIEKTYVIMSVLKSRRYIHKGKTQNVAFRYKFSCYDYYTKIKALSLYEELNSVGLLGKHSDDKFIPKQALLSDINYRKRLLAGLIDTDGYLANGSTYSITLKSHQLIKDIQFLVNSLGGRCNKIKRVRKTIKELDFEGKYYLMSFNFPKDIGLPIQLERKKAKYIEKLNNLPNKIGIHVLRSEKRKPCRVYGFELDSESHWYITDNWMVTHNSTLAMQIGKFVDPTLNLSRVVFSPDDFREAVLKAKKGECIIYDEAFTGFSSRSSLSPVNRVLVSLAMQMRQKNLFILIVLPTIFMLDRYMAMFRTKALVHVFESKGQRGYFKLFNSQKKKMLLLLGSKTMSYSVKGTHSRFGGRFYGKFALGDEEVEKEYRKKKEKSLADSEKTKMNPKQERQQQQRDILIYYLNKECKLSQRKIARIYKSYEIPLSQQEISIVLRKLEAEYEKKK